jgi:predicted KAP-like P-loop ATPase
VIGESWKGRAWGERWQIGHAAFWGRLFGSIAKLALSSLMVVLALGALVWSRF